MVGWWWGVGQGDEGMAELALKRSSCGVCFDPTFPAVGCSASFDAGESRCSSGHQITQVGVHGVLSPCRSLPRKGSGHRAVGNQWDCLCGPSWRWDQLCWPAWQGGRVTAVALILGVL